MNKIELENRRTYLAMHVRDLRKEAHERISEILREDKDLQVIQDLRDKYVNELSEVTAKLAETKE